MNYSLLTKIFIFLSIFFLLFFLKENVTAPTYIKKIKKEKKIIIKEKEKVSLIMVGDVLIHSRVYRDA
jgi:hypothetical protein